MTQNIEKFYEAGVRYLFLEEEDDGFSFTDGNYDNYKIHIVPSGVLMDGNMNII